MPLNQVKKHSEWFRKRARELYENEDIKIDDVASVDHSYTGAWLLAWVWVPDPPEDGPDPLEVRKKEVE